MRDDHIEIPTDQLVLGLAGAFSAYIYLQQPPETQAMLETYAIGAALFIGVGITISILAATVDMIYLSLRRAERYREKFEEECVKRAWYQAGYEHYRTQYEASAVVEDCLKYIFGRNPQADLRVNDATTIIAALHSGFPDGRVRDAVEDLGWHEDLELDEDFWEKEARA